MSSQDEALPAVAAAPFARGLDALLELLDVTADALAATWDQRVDAAVTGGLGGDFGPTIH
jgi:hypothetical protein